MKKGEKQKMRMITRNPWGSTHTHEQHIYGHSGIKLGNTEY